jgi:hypothetical protein
LFVLELKPASGRNQLPTVVQYARFLGLQAWGVDKTQGALLQKYFHPEARHVHVRHSRNVTVFDTQAVSYTMLHFKDQMSGPRALYSNIDGGDWRRGSCEKSTKCTNSSELSISIIGSLPVHALKYVFVAGLKFKHPSATVL